MLVSHLIPCFFEKKIDSSVFGYEDLVLRLARIVMMDNIRILMDIIF